jgi:chromosome segregation ATPase
MTEDPCSGLENQLDALFDRFQGVEPDRLQALREFGTANAHRDSLRKEIDDLKQQLKAAQDKENDITSRIFDVQKQILDILKQAAPFKDELELLRKELDKPEVRENEELFNTLLQRFNVTQQIVSTFEQQLGDAAARDAALNNELTGLTTDVENLSNSLIGKQQDLAQAEQEFESAQVFLDSVRQLAGVIFNDMITTGKQLEKCRLAADPGGGAGGSQSGGTGGVGGTGTQSGARERGGQQRGSRTTGDRQPNGTLDRQPEDTEPGGQQPAGDQTGSGEKGNTGERGDGSPLGRGAGGGAGEDDCDGLAFFITQLGAEATQTHVAIKTVRTRIAANRTQQARLQQRISSLRLHAELMRNQMSMLTNVASGDSHRVAAIPTRASRIQDLDMSATGAEAEIVRATATIEARTREITLLQKQVAGNFSRFLDTAQRLVLAEAEFANCIPVKESD